MRKIGFFGGFDKTDFIMYIARILVEMGEKVILIDASLMQKARYIIPTMEKSKSYVTNFEGIDVAIGFENIDAIKKHLGVPPTLDLSYDIALINLDTPEGAINYEFGTYEQNYFTTTFDLYSIRKAIEVLEVLQAPIQAYKIFFTKQGSKEESDYIDYVTEGKKVEWNDEILYLPFELGDQTVIYNNQRVSKIKFKRLSNQYKTGLMYVTAKIQPNASEGMVKHAFKKIEKGV
jgi:hypothetical protein